ncbi:peptidase M36, partial [Pterulicium gracile]
GGGSGTCLQTPEAAGLGEGWSDAFASWTEKTSAAVPDYYMVQWAANKPGGYRRFPYSTSRLVNPLLYSDLLLLNEPHDVGEVWANILHNVYALLVQTSGFSPTARTNASGNAGNVVFLHLFIDALQLQPCNPTFLNARDAWLAADQIRYGGAHGCVLWAAFASRGMGVGAISFINSFVTPVGQQC